MSIFDYERSKWNGEVDAEAARLVRLGVPPLDAIIQARQRVSARRRASGVEAEALVPQEQEPQ